METGAQENLPQRVGRYDVLGRLDTGGMAEILLGQIRGPSGFEHPVVIKRILPHLARDASFVRMFVDEARIAAGVRHPNVAHVHELGQEGEDLFLVMEYLEGEPLGSLLRRASARGLTIDSALSAYIIAEACAGLHAAHELVGPNGEPKNIVHRDISPQNVFVTYSGTVKVLDFGIAKAADRMTQTDVGQVKGKLAYMSPEQCRGEPIDRRSDIFAMGILLYELLTRRRLFQRASHAATLHAVLEHHIMPPSELSTGVSPEVESVCLKALDRSRRKRYESAAAMRRDLLRAAQPILSDGTPEEKIAELMRRLFAERISEKGALLERAEKGERLTHFPPTVADREIEIPEIDDGARAGTGTPIAPRRRGLLAIAIAVSAAAAIGVAVGVVAIATDDPAQASVEIQRPILPVVQQAAPETVTIAIESVPPGASVRLASDEAQRGVTPFALTLPRGRAPVVVVLSRDGYEPLEETIVPDVEQRVRLPLVREQPEQTHRARVRRPTMDSAMEPAPEPVMAVSMRFRQFN
jgi:serine/threonine-protein kinase